MSTKPLISVIMSVYNEQTYIRDAINSILKQTLSDFELIIIDDCSTDDTIKIINDIKDERIILIQNEENEGLTKNLNKAIKMCRGQYIARMDGDDICKSDRFDKQIKFLIDHPNIDLISCNTETIGDEHLVSDIKGNSMELKCKMLLRPQLAHPGFMIRARVFSEYAFLYDEYFKSAQDYDLAVRLTQKYQIGITKDVLLQYRAHEGQVSKTPSLKQKSFANEIRARLLKELGITLKDNEFDIYNKWVYEQSAQLIDYRFCKALLYRIIDANRTLAEQIYDTKTLKKVLWQQYYKWLLRTDGYCYIFDIFKFGMDKYVAMLLVGIDMIISKKKRKIM